VGVHHEGWRDRHRERHAKRPGARKSPPREDEHEQHRDDAGQPHQGAPHLDERLVRRRLQPPPRRPSELQHQQRMVEVGAGLDELDLGGFVGMELEREAGVRQVQGERKRQNSGEREVREEPSHARNRSIRLALQSGA
jgi:hypothetical protein